MRLKKELLYLCCKGLPLLAKLTCFIHLKDDYDVALARLNNLYTPREIKFSPLPSPMKKDIDLSIIVPVYNAEKILSQCLDSLVNQQTNYRYEIIIINDGSTDGSMSVIEQYMQKNSCIRVYTQKNAGISAARNKGLELSNGRYIGFIDNDDFVETFYIQKLLDKAYEVDADVVKCGHYRYDYDKKRIISTVQYKEEIIREDMGAKILDLKGFIWEGISKRNLWDICRFPDGYWYEDMITRLYLLRVAQCIAVLERPMYYYNIHDSNASKKVWKKGTYKNIDQLYLVQKLLKYSIIKRDKLVANALIYELGSVLLLRIRKLPIKTQMDIFTVAREIILENVRDKSDFRESEKTIYQYYSSESFISWYFYCLAQILKVKIANDSDI